VHNLVVFAFVFPIIASAVDARYVLGQVNFDGRTSSLQISARDVTTWKSQNLSTIKLKNMPSPPYAFTQASADTVRGLFYVILCPAGALTVPPVLFAFNMDSGELVKQAAVNNIASNYLLPMPLFFSAESDEFIFTYLVSVSSSVYKLGVSRIKAETLEPSGEAKVFDITALYLPHYWDGMTHAVVSLIMDNTDKQGGVGQLSLYSGKINWIQSLTNTFLKSPNTFGYDSSTKTYFGVNVTKPGEAWLVKADESTGKITRIGSRPFATHAQNHYVTKVYFSGLGIAIIDGSDNVLGRSTGYAVSLRDGSLLGKFDDLSNSMAFVSVTP